MHVNTDNGPEEGGMTPDEGAPMELALRWEAGLPRYLVLRNALADAIGQGRWRAGDQLPAEYEIAALAGLSVGTVQMALRMLVEEGLLSRRRGAGTFVASPEAPLVASFVHAQFLDEETGRVLPVFARAPRRGPAEPGGPWSSHLTGEAVLCLERVQSVAREFSVYARLFFDAGRFPALAEADLRSLAGASLKDALSRELRAQVTRHSHRLQVRVLPPDVSRALNLRARVTGAVLEVVAHDRMGAPVYFQDFHIPPNKRRLLVTA